MNPLTIEQVTQLAPDSASIKAARSLGIAKWTLLQQNEHTIWGHCQGSGANPYQTAVDLTGEAAFKCSCPSRKFPCKHALALLLLFSEHTDQFVADTAPSWLQTWLDKRQQHQTNKAAKADNAAPADPIAQQKRFAARLKKATDGLTDLQLWLNDIIRNGLVSLRTNQAQRCNDMAKRMIDAQLPAIASRLQQLAYFTHAQQAELLYHLTQLHLLAHSFQQRDTLSDTWQAEIYSQLGFPIAKETVLSQPAIADTWLNIGHMNQEIDRGIAHYHWLYGAHSQQFALILDFTIQGAPSQPPSVLLGAQYAGELCFYPSLTPLRALNKTWEMLPQHLPLPPTQHSFATASQQIQQQQQSNPFIHYSPVRLDAVHIVRQHDQLALGDGDTLLPITLTPHQQLHLLAHTQGQPFSAFVLFNHHTRHSILLSFNTAYGTLEIISC